MNHKVGVYEQKVERTSTSYKSVVMHLIDVLMALTSMGMQSKADSLRVIFELLVLLVSLRGL